MALTNNKYDQDGALRRSSGYLSGTYTAATVASETTASATSNSRAVSGAVIASGVMTLTLGFIPKYFKIINVTDRIMQEWYQGMNQGDYLLTVAAGTRTLATDDKIVVANTTSGSAPVVTQAAATVAVTFDSGICTDNDTVTWVAEG
mgnify:FL=1